VSLACGEGVTHETDIADDGSVEVALAVTVVCGEASSDTLALADAVPDTAVTVRVTAALFTAGAVYTPFADMLPVAGETDHETGPVAPVSVNCADCPGKRVIVGGETDMGGGTDGTLDEFGACAACN
jgi:hypothetical protein